MRLAVVAAGFTPGEADQLRRAMAAWRRPGVIEQFRTEADRRHAGQRPDRGVRRDACSSRSAASASTAFPNRTPPASRCWCMCRPGSSIITRPRFAAALHQQPADGFLRPGPTGARCPGTWRRSAAGGCESQSLGLHAGGRGAAPGPADDRRPAASASVLRIEQARRAGTFSIDWMILPAAAAFRRSRGRAAGASRCVWVAAVSIDEARLWQSLRQNAGRAINRYSKISTDDEPSVVLPAMGGREEVFADYQTVGLSLKAHPISFYRERMNRLRHRAGCAAGELEKRPLSCASAAWCWCANAPARPKELHLSRSKTKPAWRT